MDCSFKLLDSASDLFKYILIKNQHHIYRDFILPIRYLHFRSLRDYCVNTTSSCLSIAHFRHLIVAQESLKLSFEFITNRSEIRQVLYEKGSVLSRHAYGGRTKHYRKRDGQHISFELSHYLHDTQTTTQIPKPTNCSRLYKHITKHFGSAYYYFMPLILIANSDAPYCEKLLIQSLLHRALNDDTNQPTLLRAKIFKSFKHTKHTKKKPPSKRRSHKTLTQQTQQTTHIHRHHPEHHFKPKLFRTTTDNFFYIRLDKLFEDNSQNTITVRVTNGKSHTHRDNIKHCWGDSILTYNNTTYLFSQFAHLIFTHDFSGDFEITPQRTTTRDRQLFHIIHYTIKNQNTLALSLIIPHITPQDWFALYKNTTKIQHIRPLFYSVRRFIRTHLHTTLNITTQQLNSGISANLTLSYHPNINMRFVKQCHSLLIHALLNHNKKLTHCIQSNLYTTFRKSKTIGSLIINHRTVCKAFDPSNAPTCTTPHLCSDDRHYLKMPFELPDEQAVLLRNIETPIILSTNDLLADITDSLINITHKLCTPFQQTKNPLSDTISFDDTHTFFHMQHEIVTINNFTLNNLLTVFEHNSDITDSLLFLTSLTVTLHVDKPTHIHNDFLHFMATELHVTHDILSHPIHKRKHIRTFSSGCRDRLEDDTYHRLLGSIGNPWNCIWDVKYSLLTPTPENLHNSLLWLQRSINCTSHDITTLLIIPTHSDHLHNILNAKYHRHSCFLPNRITDTPHTLHVFSSCNATTTATFYRKIKRFLMRQFGFRSLSDLIPEPTTPRAFCSLSILPPELEALWSLSASCKELCALYRQGGTHTLFTQARYAAQTPFHKFRFNFFLSVYNIEQTHREHLLMFLENTVDHKTTPQKTTNTIRKIKDSHPNACFFKIDHNARQCGIACPTRYHFELNKAFILDERHFKIVKPNTLLNGYPITDDVETCVMKYTRSRLNPEWLPHTWKHKPDGLSYLYLTVKPCGTRFRPIGSSSPLPHARLLSLVSMCLNTVLKYSGLKHYTLWHTLSMKTKIHDIDKKAHDENLFIFNALFDVKNFFTDIQKAPLLARVRFFLDRYCEHNRTKYISVPKYGKKPKPKPGKDESGKYYFFHVEMILDIIEMALNTAFFKLGVMILIQILGLVMGDPLSPPLAQMFVGFDEHHHQLLNHTANTNLVHTFIDRYMDDISATVLTSTNSSFFANAFFEKLQHSYEHDLPEKHLSLVRSKDGDKFLDSDVIIFDRNRSIKIVFHNKNASIFATDLQLVGRYLQRDANAPHKLKLSAIVNTLVRIPRTTSLPQDTHAGVRQVLYEATLLDYTVTDLISVLTLTNRIEPSHIWTSFIPFLKGLQKFSSI